MNLNLVGKRALICGGSQGIGLAGAIELAALGAEITLLSRDEKKLTEALKKLSRDHQQDHQILVADLSKLDSLEISLKKYLETNTVHILLNNTGGPPPGEIIQEDLNKFSTYFSQHVLSAQLMTKLVLPGMKKDSYGRIINVLSTSVKAPLADLGVSNTMRGAMASWSKSVANEVAAFGITVNNLLPGTTETDRIEKLVKNISDKTGESIEAVRRDMMDKIPLGRFAKASEQGQAIAFLASPAASYITGTSLLVDGGRTQSM